MYNTHVVRCERYRRSSPYIAPNRSFFTPVPKIYPPGKGKGVPHRPPKIEPKPEIDRTMRYLAGVDQLVAVRHTRRLRHARPIGTSGCIARLVERTFDLSRDASALDSPSGTVERVPRAIDPRDTPVRQRLGHLL